MFHKIHFQTHRDYHFNSCAKSRRSMNESMKIYEFMHLQIILTRDHVESQEMMMKMCINVQLQKKIAN